MWRSRLLVVTVLTAGRLNAMLRNHCSFDAVSVMPSCGPQLILCTEIAPGSLGCKEGRDFSTMRMEVNSTSDWAARDYLPRSRPRILLHVVVTELGWAVARLAVPACLPAPARQSKKNERKAKIGLTIHWEALGVTQLCLEPDRFVPVYTSFPV